MLSILIFAISLLFASVQSKWTATSLLEDFGGNAAKIMAVYREPNSPVSHVIVGARGLVQYMHLAVTDEGAILYKTSFREQMALNAVLRGAGDGKRLFLAVHHSAGYRQVVSFCESADFGRTWTPRSRVASDDEDKYLADMVYERETGRVFVFLTTRDSLELRVVSRAPGSVAFSAETKLADLGSPVESNEARAGYTAKPQQNAYYVHVVYVGTTFGALMYLRSQDNGATWSVPREIAGGAKAFQVSQVLGTSEAIYVSYVSGEGLGMLLYSTDHGATFSKPITLVTKNTPENSAGISECAGKKGLLATFVPRKLAGPAYALWNTATMKPEIRATPYDGLTDVTYAGVTCVMDTDGTRKTTTTTVIHENAAYQLLVAVESERVPSERDE